MRYWFPKILFLVTIAGCSWHAPTGWLGHGVVVPPLENPLFVPVTDHEFLWQQVIDSVDNHFRIKHEERVRIVGDVVLAGMLETYPVDGSTVFEPWRKDSTHGFEKLHATFQSVRRSATIRVSPSSGGFSVEVIVQKELEDIDRPEYATVGQATARHERSINPQSALSPTDRPTLAWISIGRDISLEQRILRDIQARVSP